MLACAMSGHGLLAMAGGFAVTIQRRWYRRPRRMKAIQIVLALAVFYLLLYPLRNAVAMYTDGFAK